jgi:hypothetical protein
MTARKRPMSAQEDLAESKRRAKAARTPLAKAVTKQVVEKKQRTYSGQGAREAAAQMRRGVHPVAGGTTPKRVPQAGTKTRTARQSRA